MRTNIKRKKRLDRSAREEHVRYSVHDKANITIQRDFPPLGKPIQPTSVDRDSGTWTPGRWETPEFTRSRYALDDLVNRLMHHQPRTIERGQLMPKEMITRHDGKGHRKADRMPPKEAGKNNDQANFRPSRPIAWDAP